MARDKTFLDPGHSRFAGSLPNDGNIRGSIDEMLCIKCGDRDEADIVSKACDLDSIIANHCPPENILSGTGCYLLDIERPVDLRGMKLPHEGSQAGGEVLRPHALTLACLSSQTSSS